MCKSIAVIPYKCVYDISLAFQYIVSPIDLVRYNCTEVCDVSRRAVLNHDDWVSVCT
jgi:hypothetical protein